MRSRPSKERDSIRREASPVVAALRPRSDAGELERTETVSRERGNDETFLSLVLRSLSPSPSSSADEFRGVVGELLSCCSLSAKLSSDGKNSSGDMVREQHAKLGSVSSSLGSSASETGSADCDSKSHVSNTTSVSHWSVSSSPSGEDVESLAFDEEVVVSTHLERDMFVRDQTMEGKSS